VRDCPHAQQIEFNRSDGRHFWTGIDSRRIWDRGIKETDVEVAEAHDVVSGLELGDANELADRCLADEDELAFPHDLSVRCIR
jgi:hypothetical protein